MQLCDALHPSHRGCLVVVHCVGYHILQPLSQICPGLVAQSPILINQFPFQRLVKLDIFRRRGANRRTGGEHIYTLTHSFLVRLSPIVQFQPSQFFAFLKLTLLALTCPFWPNPEFLLHSLFTEESATSTYHPIPNSEPLRLSFGQPFPPIGRSWCDNENRLPNFVGIDNLLVTLADGSQVISVYKAIFLIFASY